MAHLLESYSYEELLTQTWFRAAEVLPEQQRVPVSCLLHAVDWTHPLEYEALSYAWGDLEDTFHSSAIGEDSR